MTTNLLRKKEFPLNYPNDVISLIEVMSYDINSVNIVGSMSLRSQQYAGDYDMYEKVNGSYKNEDTAVKAYTTAFQSKIRQLLKMNDCFIGDIKAGIIKQWEVIPEDAKIRKGKVIGYNANSSKAKIADMLDSGVLTEKEAEYANEILVENPTVNEFVLLKRELRFHLVRWKPEEVLKGSVKLRDDSEYTLEEAFKSPTIVKLDVIAYVENNRFTDFSIIYLFKNKGKAINKIELGDEEDAVKQDLVYYLASRNFFKVAKRMFSLARIKGDTNTLERLNEMLNGDLGRLYSILSDLGTLTYLFENETRVPLDKIEYEMEQFRSRLGNIYSIPVDTETILEKLYSSTNRKEVEKTVLYLEERFTNVLAYQARKEMEKRKLLPVPASYLP